MSLRFDLSGVAGFAQEFDFSLTYATVPLNLTGYTLALYLKDSATTPDALATVYAEGTGLTVTSAVDGQFTWDAPASDVVIDAPGSLWYRLDVIDSSSVAAPAMFGALWLAAA
jgi:hypothetical protein